MSAIPKDAVRSQLERILSSRLFARSARMSRFLRYTAELALNGQADEIKEYRLGTDVFDRRVDYDPRLDPIVRVEARRLRRKLCEFYETEGREDDVLIEFDKGSYVPRFRRRQDRPAEETGERNRALAVLPFANLSPEPGNEYLSDGMTEELIHALTRVEGLRVVAWNTAKQLRDRQQDLGGIGEQLQVAAALTGSVQAARNRLRVRVQLIEIASREYLWSETYDREIEDIFGILEEIARAIVRTLRVELSERYSVAPIARAESRIDSYELYLKGRYHWNQRVPEALLRSVQFFMGAIALDESSALAHAGLADAYSLMADYGVERPSEAMPKARTAALRALELDPDLAEALTSLALIRSLYDWEWEEAGQLYRRAIELNPGYATAHHWQAVDYLAMLGRFDEATVSIGRAIELDPLSAILHEGRGMILMLRRDYEAAIRYHRERLVATPKFFKTWTGLGRAYALAGCYDQAIEALEQGRSLAGDVPNILAALGQVHALAGRPDEARRMLGRLKELAATRYVPNACFALVHVALGDPATALDWLERGCELRETPMVSLFVHPIWDPLRTEPRFMALLRRMNFVR